MPLSGPTANQPGASVNNGGCKGGCDEPMRSLSEFPNTDSTSDNVPRTNKYNTETAVARINSEKPCKEKNEKVLTITNGKGDTTLTLNSANMKPGMSLLADISRNKSSVSKENKAEGLLRQSNCTSEKIKAMKQVRNNQGKPSITSNVQRKLFDDHSAQQPSLSFTGSHAPVRRTKSEGHVVSNSSALNLNSACQSPVAEVYSDATMNDKIWSKLEWNSHRDSMSSSSSKSSNDTVIDLSLPNLAQKTLMDLDISEDNFERMNLNNPIRPRSSTTLTREYSVGVTKSKSNPNLISNNNTGEPRPRSLARGPEQILPPLPRRNTWNRLYVESLKQSTSKSSNNSKASTSQSMSKSLGDLTSDDITCNFESKYRSISRSFITRSMRAQRRASSTKASTSTDSLTEQLKRLTSFEKENDITSPTEFQPVQNEDNGKNIQRTSSRSQSRVRYIANRAKQAQERQKLHNLVNNKSIEERGIPEGACAITKGFCMDSLSPSQTSESLGKFGPY